MKRSDQIQKRFQALVFSILLLTVAGFITSAAIRSERTTVAKTCAQLFPATSTHNAAFEDPIDGGTCWACPKGSKRTASSVKAADACIQLTMAQNTGKYGCKAKYGANAFPDLGACWTCPSGYTRTAEHVTSGKACAKDLIFGPFSKATKRGSEGCDSGVKDPINGGTCWSCGQGKRTVYAVNSDKACEIGVRAVKKGKAPDRIEEAGKAIEKVSRELEVKVKAVTQGFATQNAAVMKEVTKIFDKLNGPKYKSYFEPNGQFSKDIKEKEFQRIWTKLQADLTPHFRAMKQIQVRQNENLRKFTILSFGLTGEAAFVGGVSVEEGISLNFDRPNFVEVGGYVSYGAVVGITAGISSGVAVSLSKQPDRPGEDCGAGFGISAGFDVGGVGVGGGIAIDPTLSCKGDLSRLLTLDAIEGISIGVSVGVGPPVPVSVSTNFTSTTTFKVQNGRLVKGCSACGGKDQRPCSLTERYPSCDPGLAENCGVCS